MSWVKLETPGECLVDGGAIEWYCDASRCTARPIYADEPNALGACEHHAAEYGVPAELRGPRSATVQVTPMCAELIGELRDGTWMNDFSTIDVVMLAIRNELLK